MTTNARLWSVRLNADAIHRHTFSEPCYVRGLVALICIQIFQTGEIPKPEQVFRSCCAITADEQQHAVRALEICQALAGELIDKRASTIAQGRASSANGTLGGRPPKKRKPEQVIEQDTEQVPEQGAEAQRQRSNDLTKNDKTKEQRTKDVGPSALIEKIFDHWKSVTGHDRAQLDDKRRKIIAAALSLYSEADICQAITGCTLSDFHMGRDPKTHGKRFDGIELILRDAAHIDQFLAHYRNGSMTPEERRRAEIQAQLDARFEPMADRIRIEKFTHIMDRMWKACGWPGTVSVNMAEAWADILPEITPELLGEALIRHSRDPEHGRYAPRPADVLAAFHDDAAGLKAWTRAIAAASDVGTYQSVCFDDPAIMVAIHGFGGWIAFCQMEETQQKFAMQQFVKRYDSAVKNRERIEHTHLLGIIEGDRLSHHLPPNPPRLVGCAARCKALMLEAQQKSASPIGQITQAVAGMMRFAK